MSSITQRGDKTWWNYDLLASQEKDVKKANEIYLQGIKEFPKSAEISGNYAIFLSDIRKQYDEAEKYYKKALELDPDNVINNGNFARCLIFRNQRKEAKKYIEKAFELNKAEQDALTLELWFYCYAIFPKEYPESKEEIEELLTKEIQSEGWDLREILKIAKKIKHPDYPKLIEFARKISGLPYEVL